jgi:isocitrate lyase
MIHIHARTDADAAELLSRVTQPREHSVRVDPHGESLAEIARRADAWARAESAGQRAECRDDDWALLGLMLAATAWAVVMVLAVLR